MADGSTARSVSRERSQSVSASPPPTVRSRRTSIARQALSPYHQKIRGKPKGSAMRVGGRPLSAAAAMILLSRTTVAAFTASAPPALRPSVRRRAPGRLSTCFRGPPASPPRGTAPSDSTAEGGGGDGDDEGAAPSLAAPSVDLEPYRNRNNVRDQVFSAISSDGGIKVTAATVRNLVNDMMIMHGLTEVPADALGRAATCSVLLSNGMQDDQVLQMTVDGDGPLRGVVTISSGRGEVRGYVGNPGIGSMPLEEAVGRGVLKVVKNHPDWPNPYNGISAMRNFDIDRDVGIYLAESEQRSCALAAATSVTGILCKAAGGYLVERLPECDDDTMRGVERNLARLVEMDGGDRLPTNLLLSGVTPLDIAGIILDGLGMEPLQQLEPRARCECSEDRLFRSLRLLPREEVEEILVNEEKIEARCQFCGRVYRMGPDEVRERLDSAKGDPSKDTEVDL